MAKSKAKASLPSATRPNVFGYHDYRVFLKDWLAWKKAGQSRFSMRELAKDAGLTVSYLSMVMSGSRPLTLNALPKLYRPLGLSDVESDFLVLLVVLGESNSTEVKQDALRRIQSFKGYRDANPKEFEVHRYLTHWYYVAIRELASVPDFQADPAWIRKRLKNKVSLKEIEDALLFLKDGGFLVTGENGTIRPAERSLECFGGVYKLALGQFHREMFGLAAASIENTPSSQRTILGHTFSIAEKDFDKLREILNDALAKVARLEEESKSGNAVSDSVYHVELAAFPLAKEEGESL